VAIHSVTERQLNFNMRHQQDLFKSCGTNQDEVR